MNLHEYQAKELLRQFDLPLLKGKAYVESLETIEKDLNDLSGPPWVVKSQIHAGGRGAGHFKKPFNDKGGVQVIQDKTQVPVTANSMLGNILITKQTGVDGKKVNRLFIEEGCKIEREFYLSLLIDRNNSQLMLMISSAGGMNIEDVAEDNPEKIHTIYFPDLTEINVPKNLEKQLELNSSQFEELLLISKKLVRAFKSLDASTIEINPLVLNNQGNFVLLDAKLILDDNALFRHPELEKLKDITEENPLEHEASQNNMNYVKLDGSIGCMVNGAGLAMATMDIIKLHGEEPANFLDVGGGASKEKVEAAFKIILSDKSVKGILINIFGGIMRCDILAQGIVDAAKEIKISVPLVVRLAGTNFQKGKKILSSSGLKVISANNLADAAKKIVKAIK